MAPVSRWALAMRGAMMPLKISAGLSQFSARHSRGTLARRSSRTAFALFLAGCTAGSVLCRRAVVRFMAGI